MKPLQIPATVRGKINFELIDRQGKVKQSGECENLILDSGLNYIMTSTGLVSMCNYIAVGTGSTAPAASQTTLTAEVARTGQTLGLISGTGSKWFGGGRFQQVFGVAFDYGEANGNLTEFGGSANPTGTLYTRALFKDGRGNPVVISKTSDTRLVLYYTLELQVSPIVATAATIAIAGIGNVDCTYIMPDQNDGSFGYGSYSPYAGKAQTIQFYTTAAPNMTQTNTDAGESNYGAAETYTAGSFTRTVSGERPPEAADVTVYGYSMGYFNGPGNAFTKAALKVKFNTPIVKNKDYRLKFSATYSISR